MKRLIMMAACVACAVSSEIGADQDATRQLLEPLQDYVGEWKGVGQLRRGSTAGSWTETSVWAWQFEDDSATLTFQSPRGKYFRSGSLSAATGEDKRYRLTTIASLDGAHHIYEGAVQKSGVLILDARTPQAGLPARMSLRLVARGKRLVVLFERRASTGTRYLRMSEVGYTRQGSGFAKGGAGIECIVTGGTGTIPVKYKGETYYVCCGGCKDYFDANPAKVLAEYRARKAAEKKDL